MPKAYYNEIDSFAAAWLRELIRAGLIMDGEVDERDIRDVEASDLAGFTRCHFFAGIAGWDYALQLAGWPDDRPVWTGSCPCTPYSEANMYERRDDQRELWGEFERLIAAEAPDVVFGEQSASKDGYGWLDGVCADLEGHGYTCWSAHLSAASLGAPHARHRLFWLGHSDRAGLEGHSGDEVVESQSRRNDPQANGFDASTGIYDCWSDWRLVVCSEPTHCGDGRVEKKRRVQPGSFPMADGIPARVGRLRGYGNAIVPQVGAEFIGAYLDALSE